MTRPVLKYTVAIKTPDITVDLCQKARLTRLPHGPTGTRTPELLDNTSSFILFFNHKLTASLSLFCFSLCIIAFNSTCNLDPGINVMFSSPEPLGSQGELIVYPSIRRPSVRRPSVRRSSS